MVKSTLTLIPAAVLSIFTLVHDFQENIPKPVNLKSDPIVEETKEVLKIFGRDTRYAEKLVLTARAKNIDHIDWATNIEQESEYKITAKSPKGYKGLGQTPKAAMKTGYEEADLMYAACIFDEKRRIAKGDYHLAWALYKGGNNPEAKRIAAKMLSRASEVRFKINQIKRTKEEGESHNG